MSDQLAKGLAQLNRVEYEVQMELLYAILEKATEHLSRALTLADQNTADRLITAQTHLNNARKELFDVH